MGDFCSKFCSYMRFNAHATITWQFLLYIKKSSRNIPVWPFSLLQRGTISELFSFEDVLIQIIFPLQLDEFLRFLNETE